MYSLSLLFILGQVLHGKEVRIDYSVTKRAYSPTPGRYMGKVTYVLGLLVVSNR